MVNALSILLLVAVAGGALAARSNAPHRLNCKTNKSVCWSHAHSDLKDDKIWIGPKKETCAVLHCEGDQTRVDIYTPDYHEAVRTYVRPVDALLQPIAEDGCGQVAFNVPLALDPVPAGSQPVQDIPENQPVPVDLNEDYANLLEQQAAAAPVDLNADYAQMWEAMSGRTGVRNVGHKYTVEQGKCRSGRRQADPQCPDRVPHSQHTLVIKEFFAVPFAGSSIDMLTITHLIVECDICVSVNKAEYLPEVKDLNTAQCQWSEYSCVADIPNPFNIEVTFSQTLHPANDPIVGWQIGKIHYGQKSPAGKFDDIIDSNVPTAVGDEISATVTPSSGQTSSYLVRTDNVVEDEPHPPGPRLHFGCEAEYCYRGSDPAGEGVTVCPATPPCH